MWCKQSLIDQWDSKKKTITWTLETHMFFWNFFSWIVYTKEYFSDENHTQWVSFVNTLPHFGKSKRAFHVYRLILIFLVKELKIHRIYMWGSLPIFELHTICVPYLSKSTLYEQMLKLSLCDRSCVWFSIELPPYPLEFIFVRVGE